MNLQFKNQDEILRMAEHAVSRDTGIVLSLSRSPIYNDEPRVYRFDAESCDAGIFSDVHLLDRYAGGIHPDPTTAKLKAIAEVFERYSMALYRKEKLVVKSFDQLDGAIDPDRFVAFSERQLRASNMRTFRPSQSPLRWSEGWELASGKSVLIPSSLIYLPYYFDRNERTIRLPISTGAAAGLSYDDALLRGICEIVERECFTILWFNRLSPPRVIVDIEDDEDLNGLMNDFARYRIEANIFDISLDLDLFTFLCVLVDRTGVGPSVTLGMKTSPNARAALLGAVLEAQQGRPWVRHLMRSRQNSAISSTPSTIKQRALLWSQPRMVRRLEFILSSESARRFSEIMKRSRAESLDEVAASIRRCKLDIFWTDITPPDIAQLGFVAVKAVSTNMHPFHLDEAYPYYGGTRLYQVPVKCGFLKMPTGEQDLNRIPHPFL